MGEHRKGAKGPAFGRHGGMAGPPGFTTGGAGCARGATPQAAALAMVSV
jgi:hypothetical protein